MATDSMVERVAKAINLQIGTLGFHLDETQIHYVARAAIAAMREPNRKMIEEGSAQIVYDGAWGDRAEKDTIAVWQEMIDAPLGNTTKDDPCDT